MPESAEAVEVPRVHDIRSSFQILREASRLVGISAVRGRHDFFPFAFVDLRGLLYMRFCRVEDETNEASVTWSRSGLSS